MASKAKPEPRGATGQAVIVRIASLVWVTVAVLVAYALFGITRNASTALTQITMGVILALALDPLVVAVARRAGTSRNRAIAVVIGGFVVVTVIAVVFVGPPAARQAAQFGKQLPETLSEFERLPVIGGILRRYDLQRNATDWLQRLPDRFDAQMLQSTATRLLENAVSFVVVGAVIVAALLDGPRLLALIRSMVRRRPDQLARIERVGRVLQSTLGQYFGGSLTVAGLMGLFVLVVGLVLQVPLAPLAAVWAAFTDLIPQVGGLLGGGFLVLLAATKGPVPALIAGGLFLVYMNLENHVISPAIVGESVGLTPATTMVAAFVGGAVAGLPGSLIATPMVGAIKRLYLEFRTGQPAPAKRSESITDRLRGLVTRFRDRNRPGADKSSGDPPK